MLKTFLNMEISVEKQSIWLRNRLTSILKWLKKTDSQKNMFNGAKLILNMAYKRLKPIKPKR